MKRIIGLAVLIMAALSMSAVAFGGQPQDPLRHDSPERPGNESADVGFRGDINQ